ncbi:hypothetical protein YTPLAS18_18280 [Nitrospira sp.]|nr:hypothetical protein YTPLAS18_18280 [Nitrospira sp.]
MANEAFPPAPVHADTKIIPAVSASERYDSNVFFAPASLLAPGTQLSDFVSSAGAGLEVLHKSRDFEAGLKTRGDVNVYVNNTNLNYLSTVTDGSVKLDKWVGQFSKGATLSVRDFFQYTPAPPGFLTGTRVAPSPDDPFSRGIQQFRSNTFRNTASIRGSLPIFRGISIQSSYSYSLFRVGSVLTSTTTAGPAFFNTNVQTYSVGPNLRLSRSETIALLYQQSFVNQTRTGQGGPSAYFDTKEVWANYTKVVPDWTATVRGGIAIIEPLGRAYPVVSLTFLPDPERSTYVQVDLSRKVAPSYFIVGGALISNVAQVSVNRRLIKRANLGVIASYANNQVTPDVSQQFNTISTAVALRYDITRTVSANLSFTYNYFKSDQPALSYDFDRYVVSFALGAAWK